eukprot:Platyproteum_vivax@DN8636_c0_g1_i1.p1
MGDVEIIFRPYSPLQLAAWGFQGRDSAGPCVLSMLLLSHALGAPMISRAVASYLGVFCPQILLCADKLPSLMSPDIVSSLLPPYLQTFLVGLVSTSAKGVQILSSVAPSPKTPPHNWPPGPPGPPHTSNFNSITAYSSMSPLRKIHNDNRESSPAKLFERNVNDSNFGYSPISQPMSQEEQILRFDTALHRASNHLHFGAEGYHPDDNVNWPDAHEHVRSQSPQIEVPNNTHPQWSLNSPNMRNELQNFRDRTMNCGPLRLPTEGKIWGHKTRAPVAITGDYTQTKKTFQPNWEKIQNLTNAPVNSSHKYPSALNHPNDPYVHDSHMY